MEVKTTSFYEGLEYFFKNPELNYQDAINKATEIGDKSGGVTITKWFLEGVNAGIDYFVEGRDFYKKNPYASAEDLFMAIKNAEEKHGEIAKHIFIMGAEHEWLYHRKKDREEFDSKPQKK